MLWVDCGKISRDLEEMMLERGLHVDHTTIYRWVQHYAPSAVSRGQVRADHAWRFISAVDSQGNTLVGVVA